ncbi:hypothetical protein XELAEV_18031083mg [Xenopus laevis]|uniref:Uncharacterized protein n=1 Tax=Xenopus laevis TaxID=8355 RepID=A0A974CN55_XENLA|nr:hypothetical protein XELAEV_18031083mg [Xenopus laevis]
MYFYTLFWENSHINFLDTTIYIKNGTIQTSYTKNQQAVLHILCSVICSNLDDRNKHLHSLWKTFVNQGYHPQVIDNQIHRATQIPRDTLLNYKEKKTTGKMIVRSALPKTTKADQVAIPNTQKVYTILDHFFVCFIQCGQNLHRRMNHHRHKINTKSCDTPTSDEWGQHFCSQNHSLQDMQVLILKGNFKTERERKIYEFKCMELFNTLRQGLNLGSGSMSHYVT